MHGQGDGEIAHAAEEVKNGAFRIGLTEIKYRLDELDILFQVYLTEAAGFPGEQNFFVSMAGKGGEQELQSFAVASLLVAVVRAAGQEIMAEKQDLFHQRQLIYQRFGLFHVGWARFAGEVKKTDHPEA